VSHAGGISRAGEENPSSWPREAMPLPSKVTHSHTLPGVPANPAPVDPKGIYIYII